MNGPKASGMVSAWYNGPPAISVTKRNKGSNVKCRRSDSGEQVNCVFGSAQKLTLAVKEKGARNLIDCNKNSKEKRNMIDQERKLHKWDAEDIGITVTDTPQGTTKMLSNIRDFNAYVSVCFHYR